MKKHHKEEILVGGVVSEIFQSGGAALRTVHLGKLHFPLMSKGKRFIRCRIESYMLGEREHRHVSGGSMSEMTSVMHQSVDINSKGGDC
jgi:hypothetical protein